MAVSGVIESRAYFREQSSEASESPPPRKRQRCQTPVQEDDTLQPSVQQDWSPPLSPGVVPYSPSSPASASTIQDPAISEVAHKALSAPWEGQADFRYTDDSVFEDTDPNDINNETAQPMPTPDPVGLENSDSDSNADEDDSCAELSEADEGEVPHIFETNADMCAEECSKYTVISSRKSLKLIRTQRVKISLRATSTCCISLQ